MHYLSPIQRVEHRWAGFLSLGVTALICWYLLKQPNPTLTGFKDIVLPVGLIVGSWLIINSFSLAGRPSWWQSIVAVFLIYGTLLVPVLEAVRVLPGWILIPIIIGDVIFTFYPFYAERKSQKQAQ